MYQPPTDHQVIGPTADDWTFFAKRKRRRVAKPKRAANDNRLAADRVPALVRYREEPDHPYDPLASNWSVTSSGLTEVYDDDADDDQQDPLYHQELETEIRPSIPEILRAMRGDWTWRKVSPDYEGEPVESFGGLHFSNGKQRERMLKTRDGKLATYLCEVPRGALLGAVEKNGGPRGASQTPDRVVVSNENLTLTLLRRDQNGDLLDPLPKPRVFIPKGNVRGDNDLTPAESRALIASAIANTLVMPPVTICPPGIASGAKNYSDQFIGMKPKPKPTSKGGAIGWVDFFSAGRDRSEWLAVLESLDGDTRQTLDGAMTAQNYTEVGMLVGQSPEYARRKGGKLALTAANDNLLAKMRKLAA
jgi:hypothetical protein